MGFARSAFTCLMSSTSSQRPKNTHSSVLTYWQYQRQKCGIGEKLILTIGAMLLGEHVDLVAGGATIETTSAPVKRPSLTALCQRRVAPPLW